MKYYLKLFLPVLCACIVFSGCSLWMDGEYVSVTPNISHGDNQVDQSTIVSTYNQLYETLEELVENGEQDGLLYFKDMTEESVLNYMRMASENICTLNPIGSYAVDEITYEVGTNTGVKALAIDISYMHNRSEILRIKKAKDMDEALKLIRVALENFESGTVIMVSQWKNKDLIQFVEDYVAEHPQTCMEMPQVSVSYFPELGVERIADISFTYQTSRDSLRSMQQSVSNVFKSAQFYVDPLAENSEKYSQLYSFLMERYDYKFETSITPSYSLLRHGVGDSKAFAIVYAEMCRQVGLDCQVVSGTKGGEPWHWNVLNEDGVYYHVDLIECYYSGNFSANTEDLMVGYVWDYSNF